MKTSLRVGLCLALVTAACMPPAHGPRTSAYVGNTALIAAGLASFAVASSIGTCSGGDSAFSENGCGSLQNEGNGLFIGTGVVLSLVGVIGMIETVNRAEAAASAPAR